MMSSIIISILAFLVAITILVGIHEYGHFIVARLFGIKVLEFSLGFGPVLWKRRSKSGTQYQIAMVPIGGYVNMLNEREGPLPLALQAHAFNRQPIWKRCLVLLAGPFFNLLLAFICFWLVFSIGLMQIIPKIGAITPHSIAANAGLMKGQIITQVNQQSVNSWDDVTDNLIGYIGQKQPVSIVTKIENGELQTHFMQLKNWNLIGYQPDVLDSIGITPYLPEIPPIIGDVEPNSAAAQGGMQAQDNVIAINGNATPDWQSVFNFVQQHPNQMTTFTILRNGKPIKLTFQIGSQEQNGRLVGQLGVTSSTIAWPSDMMTMVHYNPWQALAPAWHKTIDLTVTTVRLMGGLITGHISLQGLSGPVGIAEGAGISASFGLVSFLSFLALISISLGIVNLVPLPLLDGGQLAICLLEGVLKRPLSEKIQLLGFQISIFFLLGVMTLALYNDIMRIQH